MLLILFASVIGNMVLLGNNMDMNYQLENLPQCTPIVLDGNQFVTDDGQILSKCTEVKKEININKNKDIAPMHYDRIEYLP